MRCLIWTLLALGHAAHAADPSTLGDRLGQALRCEGEPLTVVSWLDPLVGKDHPEAAITATGEEIEYREWSDASGRALVNGDADGWKFGIGFVF